MLSYIFLIFKNLIIENAFKGDDLFVENDRVSGVVTQMGIKFFAPTVVLTVGTFLGGCIHIGLKNHTGGRAGDPASIKLADRLRELPLRVGRLKTGTPPRIDARTIDFSKLKRLNSKMPRPGSGQNLDSG